jgi:hypothetical protein
MAGVTATKNELTSKVAGSFGIAQGICRGMTRIVARLVAECIAYEGNAKLALTAKTISPTCIFGSPNGKMDYCRV